MLTYNTGQYRARVAQARYGTVFAIAWDIDPSRDAQGRFTTYQKELIGLNRALQNELKDQVADYIAGNVKRPAVSTGRLEAATRDPKNVVDDYTNTTRWAVLVGVPAWLDNSPAKYWRTIEEGSQATFSRGGMTGMPMYPGQWGGSISGFYSNRWGRVPRAGAPFTRYGKGSGGKLRPFPQALDKGAEMKYAKREIQPMRAYGNVWRTGQWPRRFVDAWQFALDRGLVTKGNAAPGGLQALTNIARR